MKSAPTPFYGWRMVALAFIAYNFGVTVVLNCFGPVMPVLQRELNASRTGVSMGFGLLMLSTGILAPVVGNLTRGVGLRTLMMGGAALIGLGFLLLAFATTLPEVLLLFGLPIGAGVCLMALISAPTLISRWFEHDRGKALGLGLVQAAALVAAPGAAWLVSLGGRRFLFFSLAGVFAALIAVMGLVIDRPEDVGQTPRRAPTDDISPVTRMAPKSNREILMDWRFWVLCLVMGIFTASGITLASHGPAMAVAKGASITKASMVLSAVGAGTLIGAFGVGWLIDKIGPFRALIISLTFTSLTWLSFSQVSSVPLLIALGVALGAGMGPSASLHSACIGDIFGAENFGRVMGYSYFIKIPFLFGPAPLAGHLYDVSGAYGSTYLVLVTGLMMAAALSFTLAIDRQRRIAELIKSTKDGRARP